MSQDRPSDQPSEPDPTSGASPDQPTADATRSPGPDQWGRSEQSWQQPGQQQPTPQQWQAQPDPGYTPQPPYDSGQYGQAAYGQQPPYGQPQYQTQYSGQTPYDQYGQPQYTGQTPYGQPGYAPQAYAPAAGPPTNTMAILALIFAFVFAPLGIVFGFIARGQIKRTGESGDGLALAGLILGAIFTLLIIASILFFFVVVSAAVSSIPDLQNFPTDTRDFPTNFPFPPTR